MVNKKEDYQLNDNPGNPLVSFQVRKVLSLTLYLCFKSSIVILFSITTTNFGTVCNFTGGEEYFEEDDDDLAESVKRRNRMKNKWS